MAINPENIFIVNPLELASVTSISSVDYVIIGQSNKYKILSYGNLVNTITNGFTAQIEELQDEVVKHVPQLLSAGSQQTARDNINVFSVDQTYVAIENAIGNMGNVVRSVTGPNIDNSDPENPIVPEFREIDGYTYDLSQKADIDGNLTIGGIWWQDQVLTDRFTGNKQVWTAFTNNTLEIGNVSLNKVTLISNGINAFKAKVGTVEYTMYHSGNLNLDIYALTDGSNAEGELVSTIENSHTHSNKALLDSYNQTNADITDAVSKRHTHTNKAILDAISAAFTTSDDNLLNALGGLQFESDQTNAVLRIKDGNGSVLTSISLAYLNNEGTKFSYNSTNNTLDLLNDAGEVLSSIPVSSFVTNLVKSANWNGSTPYRLDFKDNAGTILFSIDYTINNIQGLQAALNLKQDKLTAGANINIVGNVISAVNTNTTYSAGAGLTLSGTTFSLPITVSGSGNYVTDVTQTTNGITVTKSTLPDVSGFVPYTGATANVNLGTRSITSTGGFIGNATTASTLATARTINGTSFNGSINITTALWGTARNITIGNTTKSVNGSGNVAWSLEEIGIPNVTGLVPYTGANQPINLNTQKITHNGIVSNAESITSPWFRQDVMLRTNNKVAYLIVDGFVANTHRQLYIEVESIAGNGEYKRLVKGFNVNFASTNNIGTQRDSRYLEVTGSGSDVRYGIGEVEKHSDTALKIPLIWLTSSAVSINKISVKAYTGSVSNLTFSIEYDATSTLTTENPYLYRDASEKWVKDNYDFRDYGLGTEAVVNTGLLENNNETGFYAFSTNQQGFSFPRAILMKRGSQNYGLIFQNSGNKVGFLTGDGSVYTAWHSGNLLQSSIDNWNTAFGWGNHTGLYAPINHTHTIGQVTGLQDALDAKQNKLVAGANIQINQTTNVISATDTIYTHPNSGVVAGSYNNVTVNAQGHVVEASNVNYALATQIPTVNNGQLSFSVFTDHFTNSGFTFSANQSTNTTATQLKLNQGIIDKVGQGATAYSWGNHASEGYLDSADLNGFIYNATYDSATHTITLFQQNEPNIVIDLPIEQLIKGVQLVGDDLVFTFEDGSTVTVPLNTLLVGVVKSVNGLTPNSQGEIILNVTDIPSLSSELDGKVNNLENVLGVGFVGGLATNLPYFYHSGGTFVRLITLDYLSLQGYALYSQLANYVPINGIATINNTKTFTSSPVVPNGTLNGHAVNLGQLSSAISSITPQNFKLSTDKVDDIPTTNGSPVSLVTHVYDGLPQAQIGTPGNALFEIVDEKVVKLYASYDQVYTQVESVAGFDFYPESIRAHIYNIIFQGTGGKSLNFADGVYAGDQLNITVYPGSSLDIAYMNGYIISSAPVTAGNYIKVKSFANLIWDADQSTWVLTSYGNA